MPNSGCPTYRKGAMKAAREELDGELEPRERTAATVDADNYDELLEKLSLHALRVLRDDLDDSDPRARQEAARVIIQARTKAKTDATEKPPELPPEERIKILVRELSEPDAELRAALEQTGFLKAKET